MDSTQAIRLISDINPKVVILMHCDSWGHFSEHDSQAAKVFETDSARDKIRWLKPGGKMRII